MVDTLIELRNIDVYQKDLLVLSDVNLTIKKGDFVYFVGVTGSGKSSLLKVLYADLKLNKGEATIAGFDLRKLKTKQIPQLRRKLGIVFQDFQLLFDRSVRDNLLFVMKATDWKDKKKMDERMMDVLTKVGLETKAHKMPHQLSGGEQQRLSIARALINDPEIILADEPTGNLDPETSKGIMKLLKSLSETGRAVLMATHDYNLFDEFPGRLVKFEDGHVLSTLE
ncbi:MAG: phosphonate ABC transporter ATP-binding protein [Bacteroidetes bacterium]|nr:MAG: phosphonate ABC transporter ATP-binding protein [Bacteroidota bacterium]